MRIARVLTRLNLGGPARQVMASDPVLSSRGHSVTVFAGEPENGEGDLSDALRDAGIDVRHVPGLRRGLTGVFRDDRRARRYLAESLRSLRPDLVHTHASKAGALGRQAARRALPDVPRVHTFHGHVLEGYFPGPISRLLQRVEAREALQTQGILAVSEATRSDLVRFGVAQRERIDICPPGVDLAPFLALPERLASGERRGSSTLRLARSIPPTAPVIGVIGRLALVKRTLLALDVFAALAGEFPDAHLVVAGDGALKRSLERRLSELDESVAGRVHLLGAVQDITPVHAAIDVLLSTSFAEGMPVAMIEAAAAGVPSVSTAVGGVPEIVQNGISGLLAVDREGLAAAVAGLLARPDERMAMGARARERVEQRHSAEALASRLEVIYERLLTSPA